MKLKEPKFLDYTKQKPHTYLFFTDIKDISRKLKYVRTSMATVIKNSVGS